MSSAVYTSTQQRSFGRILPDLIANRGLLRDVVWKDLRARYRNAMMGFLWAVLQPVLMMLILTFVFKYLLGERLAAKGLPSESVTPEFLLCGIVAWQFLSMAMMSGASSLLESGELIKKVHFPREIIPIAAVVNCLVNLVIGFVTLLVVLCALRGISALGVGLLYVPFLFMIQFAMVIGLALLLSALNVYYRDVAYMIDVMLAFGFYATPIFYPPSMVSHHLGAVAFQIYMLNPMANLITAYREALLDNHFAEPLLWIRPLAFACVVVLAGAYVFRRNAPTFADYL
jgi:ABC-type polysaccharide/polyol phosphate export permease